MKRELALVCSCVVIAFSSSVAIAQQRGQERRQGPVTPLPPASELFYRTFTAVQLAQADQREPVQQAGRGAPATVPNTANVLEEIFRRGLGPIVLGIPGQRNADGSETPYVVLKNQRDVFNAVSPTSPGRGVDVGGRAGSGRQMTRQPSTGRDRLMRHLAALKVNMIICGNGITVNDPGMRFGDLSLSPDFSAAKFPIYPNCTKCEAACPGICFMTVELNCRCFLEKMDPMRSAGPSELELTEATMPRRLRDLAAYADNMLTNWQGYSGDDFEAIIETIEIINGAFATELPFGAQDIVQWGGGDGKLILSSVRPLSEVPFLVTER